MKTPITSIVNRIDGVVTMIILLNSHTLTISLTVAKELTTGGQWCVWLGAQWALWCHAAGNLFWNKRGKYCCAVTAVSSLTLRDRFRWHVKSSGKVATRCDSQQSSETAGETGRTHLLYIRATVANFKSLTCRCINYQQNTIRQLQ